MPAALRLCTPCGEYLRGKMHEQEILEVPVLEQKRWHVFPFPVVHGPVSIVITAVDVLVRHHEGTTILASFHRSAHLAKILEPAATGVVRDKHDWQSLFIQEPIEFLNVREL